MFIPNIAAQLALVQKGFRICTGCGHANISPESAPWVTRCRNCYDTHAPARYCVDCGTEIEKDRRLWAKRRGGEAKRCYMCSKRGPRACEECGYVHPEGWHEMARQNLELTQAAQ